MAATGSDLLGHSPADGNQTLKGRQSSRSAWSGTQFRLLGTTLTFLQRPYRDSLVQDDNCQLPKLETQGEMNN